ncbi:MAG TPA: class I SAM-dependent methyltransferase [Candidatus Paceibacterota bacterium]|nr:class I SAM-dependent methyltransferase [Candidatus Woesebacteria bacterium]HOY11429.1 class I SAM-dependent methyltransferase [Candidatus Paceibacterota bacterium]HPN89396.1 class I SAM-dependent methyltransferase [Candidatus Paceibacterota bacterium]HQB26825.1 class I SAM-dependent methyltransferase [Candidatus Paceibacterota bacterium]
MSNRKPALDYIKWHINDNVKRETDNHYRTKLALKLRDKNPWEIISRLTFDSVAPNLELGEVRELFGWVDRKILNHGLKGVGVELGSGVGFMSSVIASLPSVEKVYAVEIVENIVRDLSPKVIKFVLGNKTEKVTSCVGDFDYLGLADNQADFVFDFFSLHHSPDLVKTLSEVFRVLKPGGFIFCFDKARSDRMSKEDLEKLLDKEYDPQTKILMGLPSRISHTRRQNGEREYRWLDWQQAFSKAGFSSTKHFHLARIAGGWLAHLLKICLTLLPNKWQIIFTNRWYRNKNYNDLELSDLLFCPPVKNFPKEISLMIAYKK